MRWINWGGAMAGMVMAAAVWGLTGCDRDGGGGGGGVGDVGDNNADVYVAIGDSLTDGNNGGGAPYPPRLAAMTGKTVINRAAQDESASRAAGSVGGILSDTKPGALLILLGSVDLIGGRSVDGVIGSLGSIIDQAKANKTVPVVATLTPMVGSHSRWSGQVKELNKAIRSLASDKGARLVDLEPAFGDGAGLILDDGLHPNEQGNQIMAEAFADAL